MHYLLFLSFQEIFKETLQTAIEQEDRLKVGQSVSSLFPESL